MRDEEFDEILAAAIGIGLCFWTIINLFCGAIGMLDDQKGCDKPLRRIEYVIPGYQFGCWLTGIPKGDR